MPLLWRRGVYCFNSFCLSLLQKQIFCPSYFFSVITDNTWSLASSLNLWSHTALKISHLYKIYLLLSDLFIFLTLSLNIGNGFKLSDNMGCILVSSQFPWFLLICFPTLSEDIHICMCSTLWRIIHWYFFCCKK